MAFMTLQSLLSRPGVAGGIGRSLAGGGGLVNLQRFPGQSNQMGTQITPWMPPPIEGPTQINPWMPPPIEGYGSSQINMPPLVQNPGGGGSWNPITSTDYVQNPGGGGSWDIQPPLVQNPGGGGSWNPPYVQNPGGGGSWNPIMGSQGGVQPALLQVLRLMGMLGNRRF